MRRVRLRQFGAEDLIITGPWLSMRIQIAVNFVAISRTLKMETATPIIWRQNFRGLDQPIGRIRREIRLEIWLGRRERLRVFRTLPTSVGQRSGEVREDEPLEIRVILAVVKKLPDTNGRLIARNPRALVLNSSDSTEHWVGPRIRPKYSQLIKTDFSDRTPAAKVG